MNYEKLTPDSSDLQSLTPIEDNLAALQHIFPSVVREGKVDFDALRQLLGDNVAKESELFGLQWHGKTRARRHALTPSLGTLRPCKEESKNWDTTKNLYIEGDNLEVLKLLQKSYAGKVKMIYIDPPYNTGKEFVYPDDYEQGIENYIKLTNQQDKFKANAEVSGRYHTDWLNMMYPRLLLARELLKDDGLIFVSIDENEFINLKHLLNDIFGEFNNVTDIVWKNRYNSAKEKHIAKIHEYIFIYCKNKSILGEINIPTTKEYIARYFKYKDDKYVTRGPFRLQPLEAGKSLDARPNLIYPIEAPDGEKIYPKRQWKWEAGHVKQAQKKGELYFSKKETGWSISTKQYLRDENGIEYGIKPFSIIDDIFTQKATAEITNLFNSDKIFPFPKPTELISHLMDIANFKDDDILIDFFGGSGTSADALFQRSTNRKKGRFIMVQLPEPCEEGSEAAKAGYANICEIGKERIRRAGEKVKEAAGLAGQDLDIGFRVFKLDRSNVVPWDTDAGHLGIQLENESNLRNDRSSEDIFYEVLLKQGIELTEDSRSREIAGHTVYSLGYGQFYCCFDERIGEEAQALAAGIALWHEEEDPEGQNCIVYVRDSAFDAGDIMHGVRGDAGDARKTSFCLTLEQSGIMKVKGF